MRLVNIQRASYSIPQCMLDTSPSILEYSGLDINSDTSHSGKRLGVDILPTLKREDSHGTVPLGWDIVVYDVTCF